MLKLHEQGHDQVADWILEVVTLEGPVLYYNRKTTAHSTGSLVSASVSSIHNSFGSNATKRSQQKIQAPLTTMGLLASLGQDDVDDGNNSEVKSATIVKRRIRQLDAWGIQGRTAWPYSWSVVQEAADQIHSRLHVRSSRRPDQVVQLIPKAIWEKQQQLAQSNDTVSQDRTASVEHHELQAAA
jgi:hypothetical protein